MVPSPQVPVAQTLGAGGPSMSDNRLIDGRAVQKRILGEVATGVVELSSARSLGRLVSISIGERPEIAVYIRGQARAAAEGRHSVRGADLAGDAVAGRLQDAARAMNDDAGRARRHSAAAGAEAASTCARCNPRSIRSKDIEGMNPASIGNIVYNDLALAPCTAAASVELIEGNRPRTCTASRS